MKYALPFAMLLGAALLMAADVAVDYNHSTDFARYHTYSWLKVDASNTLWSDRIQRDVDGQFAAKGWTRVPSGGDAAVAAMGATHEQQTLNTFYDGLGGGWFWGGFGPDYSTTTVENTPVGTLVVDLFDASSKKLIWRGTASKALSEKPEKNEKKLEDSVQDMFKHFPPQPRG